MSNPEIPVTCANCGHAFLAQAKHAGTEVSCPECSNPTAVPAAAESAAELAPPPATLKAPRRRPTKPTPLKRPPPTSLMPKKASTDAETTPRSQEGSSAAESEADPVEEGTPATPPPVAKKTSPLHTKPKCPECGRSMEKDTVICLNCGYDLRGEVPATKPTMVSEPKTSRPIAPILVAVILVCSAAFYIFGMKKGPAPSPPAGESAPPENPAAEPAPFDPASAPAPAEEPATGETSQSENPDAPSQEIVPVEDSAVSAERQRVIDRLDAQQPLFVAGDVTLLRTQDGTVYRGKIIEINDTAVRLYYQGSEGEVPIRALTPRSRSQIDPAFREQLIEELTKREQDREAE